MNSLKCARCGLVYLVRDNPSCPRCGTLNEVGPPPAESRRGAWGALAALACTLLLVGGCAFYYLRPEPPPAYVEAIRSSEQFKRLATVRVNRAPLNMPDGRSGAVLGPNGSGERGVTAAAYVLEARGLLSFTNRTMEHRSTMESNQYSEHVYSNGARTYTALPPHEIVTKTRHLVISLTPSGEKEAEGWGETEEAYGGRPDVRFWRVPIGEAEFVGIGQVIDGPGEGGVRKLSAEVIWRWRPSWLGQSFDAGGQVMGLLPEKARAEAARMGLDSSAELKAWAQLEPTADGGWRVLSVEQMAVHFGGDFTTAD
jgi:hypothetical protein